MSRPSSLASLLLLAALACVLVGASANGRNHQGRSYISRRRHLSQAMAVANAVANSNGGNAVVNSNAGAFSTDGKPAVSVVEGKATAGPGETVRVDCNSFAVNSIEYKRCVGNPSPSSPPVASPPSVTWESAPACNASAPGATCNTKDSQGRCWGFQNNRSCAYKDATGAAIASTSIGVPANVTTPTPSPSPSPSPSPVASPSATATASASATAKAGARRRNAVF